MRLFAFIFFLLLGITAQAQYNRGAFYVGWNTLKPLSDKEFTSKTSSAGIRIGYSKFVNERFSYGIEGGYNTLDDYVPRTTYEYPGGAVTTDKYNYLYYFTMMGTGQYNFTQSKNFVPYASLAMGVAFSEYRIYYNVYNDSDKQTSFVVRPEVGTLFRVKEYSKWGLKSSLSYDFAANKSDYFETKNFSGINFLIGIVIFTD